MLASGGGAFTHRCVLRRAALASCTARRRSYHSSAARGRLNVVLIQPDIPGNPGCIGRPVMATGCSLHLVHPLGFSTDERALRRAGLDYWPRLDVTEHASWADFVQRELCVAATHTLPIHTGSLRDCLLLARLCAQSTRAARRRRQFSSRRAARAVAAHDARARREAPLGGELRAGRLSALWQRDARRGGRGPRLCRRGATNSAAHGRRCAQHQPGGRGEWGALRGDTSSGEGAELRADQSDVARGKVPKDCIVICTMRRSVVCTAVLNSY